MTSNLETEGVESKARRAGATSSAVDAREAMLMRMEKRMNLKASLRTNNLDKPTGKRTVRFAAAGERGAGRGYGRSGGASQQSDDDILNAAWAQAEREAAPVRLDESF